MENNITYLLESFADDDLLVCQTPVSAANELWHINAPILASTRKVRLIVTDDNDEYL